MVSSPDGGVVARSHRPLYVGPQRVWAWARCWPREIRKWSCLRCGSCSVPMMNLQIGCRRRDALRLRPGSLDVGMLWLFSLSLEGDALRNRYLPCLSVCLSVYIALLTDWGCGFFIGSWPIDHLLTIIGNMIRWWLYSVFFSSFLLQTDLDNAKYWVPEIKVWLKL